MSLLSSFRHHTDSFHDYSEHELKEMSELLCTWYKTNRRKLPWRGDKPPYTTYNDATEEISKTISVKGNQKSLTSFFSVVPKKPKEVKSESNQNTISDETSIVGVDLNITPYHIWVSEVMLQQTRVDTVIPKYLLWMKTFPTVHDLAVASEDKVQSLWSGLGYYRRAKMLHEGAKYIEDHYDGKLPDTVNELLKIKGIGNYTAGAISSIAFNHPDPLVDGNVLRVFSRYRLLFSSPSSTSFNTYAWNVAKRIVCYNEPSILNQALMELGAIICVPKSPKCQMCPLSKSCYSYQFSTFSDSLQSEDIEDCSLCSSVPSTFSIDSIPLPNKKTKVTTEYIYTLFVDKKTKSFYLSKKIDKGVLQGKLQPFYLSFSSQLDEQEARTRLFSHILSQTDSTLSNDQIQYIGKITHKFSHIHHYISIYKYEIGSSDLRIPNYNWYSLEDISNVGLTTWLKKILGEVQGHQGNIEHQLKRRKQISQTLEYSDEESES